MLHTVKFFRPPAWPFNPLDLVQPHLPLGDEGDAKSLWREEWEKPRTKQGVYAGETGSLCRGSENGAGALNIRSGRSAYQERALRISRAAAQVPQFLNVYFFMAT